MPEEATIREDWCGSTVHCGEEEQSRSR